MPFEARYKIYWHHTDAAGIAHFSRILTLVEQAEEDFYTSRGLLKTHARLPRREVYISFTSPVARGDEVSVRLWAGEVRTRAVKYLFEIYNITRGAKAAEGHIVVVCVDAEGETLTAIRCPEELINAWRENASPPEAT
ncbi:MAG: acyl-CoA thioesterase [Pyrobaculum sp.]